MDGLEEYRLIDIADSTEDIPVLDIAPFLAGEPGARERIGAELRRISETIGFFYLTGHGVPQDLVDGAFAQSKRFHEQPYEIRSQMPKRKRGGYTAHEEKKAGLRSSYVLYREMEPGDPRLDPENPYRLDNSWPDNLPGFREAILAYYDATEKMALAMMPLWAEALELPPDYFARFFNDPYLALSLIYYPPQKVVGNGIYGVRPHTDNTVMTVLAQHDVPGLAVRMPSGRWRVADVKPGAFMINSGNTMTRWTNGRFLSTKHRVINISDKPRYSIPFFLGTDLDAVLECLPTCTDAEDPPQYDPITYKDLQDWFFFSSDYVEVPLNRQRAWERRMPGTHLKT